MPDAQIAAHVNNLRSRDANAGYASLLALEAQSRDSEAAAAYFDDFAALLAEKNGFLRARGFRLIAANAKWVAHERLLALLPGLLGRLQDPKPIVIRQCMAALPELTAGDPALVPAVREALERAVFDGYSDAMRPLLEQDRTEALRELERTTR